MEYPECQSTLKWAPLDPYEYRILMKCLLLTNRISIFGIDPDWRLWSSSRKKSHPVMVYPPSRNPWVCLNVYVCVRLLPSSSKKQLPFLWLLWQLSNLLLFLESELWGAASSLNLSLKRQMPFDSFSITIIRGHSAVLTELLLSFMYFLKYLIAILISRENTSCLFSAYQDRVNFILDSVF